MSIETNPRRARQVLDGLMAPDQVDAALYTLGQNGYVIVSIDDVTDPSEKPTGYRSMIGRRYRSRDRRESHRVVTIVKRCQARETLDKPIVWEATDGFRTTYISDKILSSRWTEES